MSDIAKVLRTNLGAMPPRCRPGPCRTSWSGCWPGPGQSCEASCPGSAEEPHSTAKAERQLGWQRRPARDTIVDCARSLVDHHAIG